jgi:3-hydroxyacyl-CoA dehydrogenase
MSRLIIRKVAVLGAGVMGAQIAAHCANADVPVSCSTCRRRKATANGIVQARRSPA